jgi:hypothetical protein
MAAGISFFDQGIQTFGEWRKDGKRDGDSSGKYESLAASLRDDGISSADR